MAGNQGRRSLAAGRRELPDFCRKCKDNITGRKIQEVAPADWCCACLFKLAGDHTHICEYDYSGKKNQCVHCAYHHYSNKDKPCVGPPRQNNQEVMATVSNLVKSAKDLCSAEWEFSKFKHRVDTFHNSIEADYKTSSSEVEFRGKMAERKLVVDRLRPIFEEAAKKWKDFEKKEGGATAMAKKRLEEEKAKLSAESGVPPGKVQVIFKRSPAPQFESDATKIPIDPLLDPLLDDLTIAEMAIDNALKHAVETGVRGTIDPNQDRGQAILRRIQAISEAQNVLWSLLQNHQRDTRL